MASPDRNNEDGWTTWEGAGYRRDIDARWKHCLVVVDREGNIVETWSQWDSMFVKPHAVHVNPYDPDKHIWVVDAGTTKLIKYDLDGMFQYSWGTWGTFPGGMWGVHGMSADEEGNFYIAEVNNGRVQKYRPRPGVDPDLLIGRVVAE